MMKTVWVTVSHIERSQIAVQVDAEAPANPEAIIKTISSLSPGERLKPAREHRWKYDVMGESGLPIFTQEN